MKSVIHYNLRFLILSNVLYYSKEVRAIIDTIKKLIKNKKKDSPSKLLALKLLNDCLTQANNDEFLSYTDTKIMRRLA